MAWSNFGQLWRISKDFLRKIESLTISPEGKFGYHTINKIFGHCDLCQYCMHNTGRHFLFIDCGLMKKKKILEKLLKVVDQNKRAFCRLIAGADPEFFLGGVHH